MVIVINIAILVFHVKLFIYICYVQVEILYKLQLV